MTRATKAETIAIYHLRDIDRARAFRDQMREECWDAFLKRAGDKIFLLVSPPQ